MGERRPWLPGPWLLVAMVGACACSSVQAPPVASPASAPGAPVEPTVAAADAGGAPDAGAPEQAPAAEPPPAAPVDTGPPTGAGPWRYALAFDAGMSHVAIVLVLLDDRRPVRGLFLGRFLNNCAERSYARLVGGPRGRDVVAAVGCLPMADVAPGRPGVAVRAIRRGDALVAQTGDSRARRVAHWTDGATLPLPAGATLTQLPGNGGDDDALQQALRGVPVVGAE